MIDDDRTPAEGTFSVPRLARPFVDTAARVKASVHTKLLAGFLLLPTYPAYEFRTMPLIGFWLTRAIAIAFAGAGLYLVGRSLLALGRHLSPFPKPRSGSVLITTGTYAIVRHPMYTALLLGALAWCVWWFSAAHLLGATALFAFLDAKASREEKWLCETHSEYEEYRENVGKLIPRVH